MNVLYLKYNGKKLYLTEIQGVNAEETKIELNIKNDSYDFNYIRDAFTGLTDVIIYSAIVQEDGRETDEVISQEFPTFTALNSVAYSVLTDVYTVTMIEPDIIDQRLTALEKKSEELPPLTSPFTTNLEPTGVATRYYEKDELIAIYNNGLPITVKATIPISYKQPIIIDLNCELYLGGN